MKSVFNNYKFKVNRDKALMLLVMMITVLTSKAQFQGSLGGGSSSGSLGSSSSLGSSHYTIQGKDNVFAKPIQLSGQASQSNQGAQANVFGGPGQPGGGSSGGITGDPQPIPIDGGLSVLLAAGVAYHLKRKKERQSENGSIEGINK